MAEENKYMDDAFKRLGEEMNARQYRVPYSPSFWEDAKSMLDDDNMDQAFRKAAESVTVLPDFTDQASIDDVFMDTAFTEAANNQDVNYNPEFFKEFLDAEKDLSMDEAFTEAASSVTVDYHPEFWNDADEALQEEGLHYEYHSAYWQEAKKLLDREDRRGFFMRWSAAAMLLLLLSFGGLTLMDSQKNTIASYHEEQVFGPEDVHDKGSVSKETTSENKLGDNESILNGHISGSPENITSEGSNVNIGFNAESALSDDNSAQSNNYLTGVETQAELIQTRAGSDLNWSNEFDLPEISEEYLSLDGLKRDNIGIEKLSSPSLELIETAQPNVVITEPKPSTVHELSLIADAGIGSKYGDFDFMPTTRASFGVEYLVTPGINSNGIQFGGSFMINHVRQNKLGYEDRSVVYDIHGNPAKKYWTKVHFKDLIYANVNLLAYYTVIPKHKLQFGIGFERLLSVRSNMSYLLSDNNEIETINNNWGVKNGINEVDFRFHLGYEYQMSRSLSLRVNSHFGLFDRTDDEFFNNDQKDAEIGIQVGLKYNILRRVK